MERKERSRKRFFCGHCEEFISKSLYYRHRQLYFEPRTKQWSKELVHYEDSDDEFMDLDLGGQEAEDTDAVANDMNDDDNEQENASVGPGVVMPSLSTSSSDSSELSSTDTEIENDVTQMEEEIELLDVEHEHLVDGPEDHDDHTSTTKLMRLYVFFLFMYQTIFRISDAALSMLLVFFSTFLNSLGHFIGSERLQKFASELPRSIRAAKKLVGRSQSFRKYVCCRKCHTLYQWGKCKDIAPDKTVTSKLCSYIKFPDHPQSQHRKPCGTPLMKKVQLASGRSDFVPHLIYCYKSIIESLQDMILREGFIAKCEQWRDRNIDDCYEDVYDGNVWKEFQTYKGKEFLSLPYNFGLHLNVDWFQPFKHTQHAEGVIFATIFNLPRSERYLQENIILFGVIPGPKEPKKHINSFLKPLVNDLKDLWEGTIMCTSKQTKVLVRAALLCVGCDIPAARKCCGFVGHGGFRGCSKCLTAFPTAKFGEKADYSNFLRDSWVARSGNEHKSTALQYKECTTRAQQKDIEHDTGIRYSVLVELPYFDVPRMCIVDPMHNLLLGTSKHMIELWKDKQLLTDKQFEELQSRVDEFVCPGDVGRLPTKISSSFSGFTAEQWKNWTCFFSLVALKGVIPWQHYRCWQLFVKACYIICRRKLTKALLEKSDALLNEFCLSFVALYGKKPCTMNMHLHGHLFTCVQDYGPVYSFWLFSYERMNGVLGSYHTNNHFISMQLMQRFLDFKIYAVENWPKEFQEQYGSLIKDSMYNKGSLTQVTFKSHSPQLSVKALPPVTQKALSNYDILSLKNWSSFSDDILMLYRCCHNVHVSNIVVGRRYKSSVVSATKVSGDSCLAEVLHFAEVFFRYASGETRSEWVVAVKWFEPHQCKLWFGYPTQVWSVTQEPGYAMIPLFAINSRVVYARQTVDFGRVIGSQSVIVAVPLEHSNFCF